MKNPIVLLVLLLLFASVQQSYAQNRKERRAKQKAEKERTSTENTEPTNNMPDDKLNIHSSDTTGLNTTTEPNNFAPGTLTDEAVKQRTAYFYNGNWKSLKERAKQDKKVFMVDFYTDWCYFCKIMDRELFAQDEAIQLFDRHFLAYKLNAEKDEKQIAQDYNITAYPTFVFFDYTGNEIGRITGYLQKESFLQEAKKYIPKTPNTKYTKFR